MLRLDIHQLSLTDIVTTTKTAPPAQAQAQATTNQKQPQQNSPFSSAQHGHRIAPSVIMGGCGDTFHAEPTIQPLA
jgi:hypothetical protein